MQPLDNSKSKKKIYDTLKHKHLELINNSDIWNWNSLATLTRSSLQRILHLDFIIRLSVDLPGDIFEFGCHYGASTSILINLLKVYSPNGKKVINTFDTFSGFPSVNVKDKNKTGIPNKAGDFNIAIENYESFLENIIKLHDQLDSSLSNSFQFTLTKGDVSISLPKFLEENPAKLASLVILDMDLYEPTKNCLELLENRLLPGSILVFDEILSSKQFPGESRAFLDCKYRNKLKPIKYQSLVPYASVFEYQP